MGSTAAVEIHGAHAEHHELGFIRTYIFSTDHKMIAKQFLFVALFMMAIGGLMAMLMRLELGWPENQWTILKIFPETLQQDSAITPNILVADNSDDFSSPDDDAAEPNGAPETKKDKQPKPDEQLRRAIEVLKNKDQKAA